MLTILILREGFQARGSGSDLETYFSRLAQCPAALPRAAFGRQFFSTGEPTLNLPPGVPHRLALRVWSMGGHNSPVAQLTHECILQRFGCLTPDVKLSYGDPFPVGDTLEGVYQDDHLVIGLVKTHSVKEFSGRDFELSRASIAAAADAKVPVSGSKSFGFCKPLPMDPEPAPLTFDS